jgi:exopolysaccharide production protein ExoZ
MKRLEGLDYLRGLAAFGIMCYHFTGWILGAQHVEADSVWTRIGIYGVAIFYILSGLTLYLVYRRRQKEGTFSIGDFYIKRVFRIFPLLWIVIILTMLIHKSHPSLFVMLLNFSGLFSVFQWDKYIGTGVWSIGNELSFYLLFPIIFVPLRKYRLISIVASFIIIISFGFFALELGLKDSLVSGWKIYINPLNQAGLFILGIWGGYYLNKVVIKKHILLMILATSVALFLFFPISGKSINLVANQNRIIFTMICAGICVFFYKSELRLPFIHRPLTLLGEASYSVYLLHPIIWFSFKAITPSQPPVISFVFCIAATLGVSYLVYRYFEKPFMLLGKTISEKLIPPPESQEYKSPS